MISPNITWKDLDVKVICRNASYDFQVGIMKWNGYRLKSSIRRLEFYLFGDIVYELNFRFDPSKDIIKRWMSEAVAAEEYEKAEIFRQILDDNKNNYK